jgi:hypothetical protein
MRVGSGTGPRTWAPVRLRGVYDLARRGIEDAMVVGFEPDANILALHFPGIRSQKSVVRIKLNPAGCFCSSASSDY